MNLDRQYLGRTGLVVTRIGFGAFKIGRNQGIKYQHGYDLPSDEQSHRLLTAVVDDLGINYVDTAPAYGLSEERVGRSLGARTDVVISTKVGETFANNASHYDFSDHAIRRSLARSRQLLGRDTLDLVFIHSNDDEHVLHHTDAVKALLSAKQRGEVRAIGLSSKSVAGSIAALDWADAIMVEYHLNHREHEPAVAAAAARGCGVIVKKALASGTLPPEQAISFVLNNPAVAGIVIGGLNIDHLRANAEHSVRIR